MALPGTFDRTAVVAGWFDPTAQPAGWGCEDALQNASSLTDYSIDAQPGAFAVSGAVAGLLADRALDAQPGTFGVTGSDATLERVAGPQAYELDAQPGAFALAGSAALNWSGEPVEVAAPAVGGAGSTRRRRWYQIDDRVYWAHERELPALLQLLVEQPAPEPAKPQPKPVKRGRRRRKAAPAMDVPAPQIVVPEARHEALLAQFQAQMNDEMLAALGIVRARMLEEDDDEVLLLL